MDLRVVKTKMMLKKALFELAKTKSFNKVTVTELSKKAVINKATFYLHYSNIFDLIEEIEEDFINDILNGLGKVDSFFRDVDTFFDLLDSVLKNRREFIEICIKNNRISILKEKIVNTLSNKIMEENPHIEFTEELRVVLNLFLRGVIDPELYRKFNYSDNLFKYFKELIKVNSNYYKNKSKLGFGEYTVK